ncbi:MAG TPA: hypothetical protein VE476_03460 [Propionibacteriaceae bacterium]|nr:hypothetical protein [Propionibacteriaceae bacterium]
MSIVALVAIVFAWRGSFPARKVAVAGCLVPALRPAGVLLLPDRRCMPRFPIADLQNLTTGCGAEILTSR